ncbi:hypothetical protein IT087_04295 [Candidatus Uhrbacteria bacterium]|nr:hypothetical protein [Candidatus Uhrbacteria bacterium]
MNKFVETDGKTLENVAMCDASPFAAEHPPFCSVHGAFTSVVLRISIATAEEEMDVLPVQAEPHNICIGLQT